MHLVGFIIRIYYVARSPELHIFQDIIRKLVLLTLQRGVTGTARMLHALTHSSISRQVKEQM